MKKLLIFIFCAALVFCATTALADELTVQAELIAQQDYPVYSASGATAMRGADNDALLPAGSPFEVYDIISNDEGEWLLIQYAVDEEHSRFGYIAADALPEGVTIGHVSWEIQHAWLNEDAVLTDDPLRSGRELLALPEGQDLTVVSAMGDWAYVISMSGDWAMGFVRQDQLRYDAVYDLVDHSEGFARGLLIVTPYSDVKLAMWFDDKAVPAHAFLLKDELQGIEIGTAEPNGNNNYMLDASLPGGTTSISFIPVDADGTQGETLFRVEW